MRSSTKLKRILVENTIGISHGFGGWYLTVISIHYPFPKKEFDGQSFSEVVSKAYKMLHSEQEAQVSDTTESK